MRFRMLLSRSILKEESEEWLLIYCPSVQPPRRTIVTRMKLKVKGQHFQLEYSYRKQIVGKAREYFT